MIERVKSIFNFLDQQNINYLLLRPIDLNLGFNDIDLLVQKSEFKRLLIALEKSDFFVQYQLTNSNASIKIYVNGVVLDIQHNICFLPYKGIVIKKEAPFSSIRLEESQFVYPDVSDEVLFTFWTYRLFLDKEKVDASASYIIYKSKFEGQWKSLITTPFFKEWTVEIFTDENFREVLLLLTEFFSTGMEKSQKDYNTIFKGILFNSHTNLATSYFFDKLKFKILRRLGYYNKIRDFNKLLTTYHEV